MRVFLCFLLGALVALPIFGQQPNCDPVKLIFFRWIATPNPELIGNNLLPGPHFVQLPAVWTGGGVATLSLFGAPHEEGWAFAQQGPPTTGSLILPGGIVDLDVTRIILVWNGFLNIYGNRDIGTLFYPSIYYPFSYSFQGLVIDPASPVGYTITAAIHVVAS